ncbi:hypothetical protein AURDEDRAFT_165815 [Auricularia subglabra TFB-10046 SS5]|nr:hypothetical protein AURDEDRAFT_165815 [Auricularia subglabra TFB-10046 SS5]
MATTTPRRNWLPWTESLRHRAPSHLASLFKVPRAADVLESGFEFYNPRRLVALATTLDSLSIAPAAAHAGWGCLWVAHATFDLPRVVHPASIDQVSCLLLPAASVSHTTRRIFLAAQRVWMVSRGGLYGRCLLLF